MPRLQRPCTHTGPLPPGLLGEGCCFPARAYPSTLRFSTLKPLKLQRKFTLSLEDTKTWNKPSLIINAFLFSLFLQGIKSSLDPFLAPGHSVALLLSLGRWTAQDKRSWEQWPCFGWVLGPSWRDRGQRLNSRPPGVEGQETLLPSCSGPPPLGRLCQPGGDPACRKVPAWDPGGHSRTQVAGSPGGCQAWGTL